MKTILFIISLFFLSGCVYVNDRGIDMHYYNQCKEYYDSMGIYHKTCDKNLIEFKDVKDISKKVYKNVEKSISE